MPTDHLVMDGGGVSSTLVELAGFNACADLPGRAQTPRHCTAAYSLELAGQLPVANPPLL